MHSPLALALETKNVVITAVRALAVFNVYAKDVQRASP